MIIEGEKSRRQRRRGEREEPSPNVRTKL